jgi:hypothetical protein
MLDSFVFRNEPWAYSRVIQSCPNQVTILAARASYCSLRHNTEVRPPRRSVLQ